MNKYVKLLVGLFVLMLFSCAQKDLNDCNCTNEKIELISRPKLDSIYRAVRIIDKNGVAHELPFYPVKDILGCAKNKLNSEDFIGKYACPICKKKSEHLLWIMFRSPAFTWANMCGVAGPMSICCRCKIPVQFIVKLRN